MTLDSGITVLHIGSTGLVGRDVLARLLADDRVARVIAPVRRPQTRAHSKLFAPVVDFSSLPDSSLSWQADVMICTLGTTLRHAGSRDAFRQVDHDLPLQVATLARWQGANACVLNSAAGANPRSWFFYNRVKGELERDLLGLGFPSVCFVRPGLIGGDRDEHRPGEALAATVLGLLGPVLPRGWRLCPAGRIAQALIDAALEPMPGLHVIPAGELSGPG